MPYRIRVALLAVAGIASFAAGMAIDCRFRLSGWREDAVVWGALAIYAVLLYRATRLKGPARKIGGGNS